MNVGIRELKRQLSKYISLVREGETVIVTDRGKPVARLERIPTPPVGLPPSLQRLADEGRLIYKPPSRDLPAPISMLPGDKTLADYVSEQRR